MPAAPIRPERVEFTGDAGRIVGDRWVVPNSLGTVILLHGGGQTRNSWHRAGDRLSAEGWTTVSLDSRGHGESDWAADGDYSGSALVGDLRRVIASLNGSPPVLVGASMGGSTSLIAAGQYPGLARGLVLVDIVPRVELAGAERIGAFMQLGQDGFDSLEDVAAAIQAYNPHRKRPATPDGIKKNVRLRADNRWYWHWDPRLMERGSEPSRDLAYEQRVEAARAISIPTLLVRGKESDIVSDEGVREFLELIPAARFIDVSNAGHMVAGDDNDVFGSAVAEFLRDLPPV
jgi:pimeloyl-ACP methyl ester carboxylesterase